MVVSFGIGSFSKHRSFPRKRESSPSAANFLWLAEWIPAFAGMTALGNARGPQMTLAPHSSAPAKGRRIQSVLSCLLFLGASKLGVRACQNHPPIIAVWRTRDATPLSCSSDARGFLPCRAVIRLGAQNYSTRRRLESHPRPFELGRAGLPRGDSRLPPHSRPVFLAGRLRRPA